MKMYAVSSKTQRPINSSIRARENRVGLIPEPPYVVPAYGFLPLGICIGKLYPVENFDQLFD